MLPSCSVFTPYTLPGNRLDVVDIHRKHFDLDLMEKLYNGEYTLDGVQYASQHILSEDLYFLREAMEYRNDDVIVASFPKSGTTWVQEIVWSLQHLGNSDESRNPKMFQALERPCVAADATKTVERWPMKTHLNSSFFHRQLHGETTCPKIIVVCRNPKDVAVSYYHFHKLVAHALPNKRLVENWDTFYRYMSRDRLMYGSIFDNVLSWWKYRDHDNVMCLKYEDLKANPGFQTKLIAEFLGVSLSDDVIDDVAEKASFDVMRGRPKRTYWNWLEKAEKLSGESFFRNGRVGGWRDMLSADQLQYFDRNIRERYEAESLVF